MTARDHTTSKPFSPTLVALAVAIAGTPSVARADERFLFTSEASVAVPLTTTTATLYGAGGSGAASIAVSFDDVVTTGLRLEGGVLSDAPPPGNHLRDVGVGAWGAASLLLRVRPLVTLLPDTRRATGLTLEVGAGAALSGDDVLPALEASIGWGIAIDDVVLVPTVGVTHVLSWDDPLGGVGAIVGRAGLAVVLGDAPRALASTARASDRDGDGLSDDDDFCPDEPEDADGFLDDDGCPDHDDDQDGIDDVRDACRLEPEDYDGDADEDGCPEADSVESYSDRDADGLADVLDACPDEAEVINAVADEDGCPDEGLFVLTGDRVVLDDRVLFDLDSAHVHHDARRILAAVVTLFQAHAGWDRVRVEGHTDERGSDDHNLDLSERRARAVLRALVSLGLAADRIDVGAYGESRPIEHGTSEAVYAHNRRVEIVMIDDGAPEPEPEPEPEATPSILASIHRPRAR